MATFWRVRDKITGKELKFHSNWDFESLDELKAYAERFHRNMEVLEYAPWNEAEHGGLFYPVPIHLVQFYVKPVIDIPKPKRFGVLIQRKLLR